MTINPAAQSGQGQPHLRREIRRNIMKLHYVSHGARARAEHTQIRIHPACRCVCGHVLKGYDFDIRDDGITLDCPRCFTRLLEIEFGFIDASTDAAE
jgi:hypothetical protein